MRQKGLRQWVKSVALYQSLNRSDVCSVVSYGQRQTGIHAASIQENGACPHWPWPHTFLLPVRFKCSRRRSSNVVRLSIAICCARSFTITDICTICEALSAALRAACADDICGMQPAIPAARTPTDCTNVRRVRLISVGSDEGSDSRESIPVQGALLIDTLPANFPHSAIKTKFANEEIPLAWRPQFLRLHDSHRLVCFTRSSSSQIEALLEDMVSVSIAALHTTSRRFADRRPRRESNSP